MVSKERIKAENDAAGKTGTGLPLNIDYERYAEALEGADPNEQQVRELIETLFHI